MLWPILDNTRRIQSHVETLSFWANLGSLVGLSATLWTAWSAYRSKKYYLLVGRVPEHVEALRIGTRDLAVANGDPDAERRDQLMALKNTRVALESIARHIGRKHKREFTYLRNRIETVEQNDPLDPNELDNIWAEGEALANKAEEIVRDEKFTQ